MYLCGGPPFRKDPKTKKVYDGSGTEMKIYDGAYKAISHIWNSDLKHSVKIGYASRTEYPGWARQCLGKLHFIVLN